MPVFKPRNRLVNFRLSEEEFERLQAGCRLNGARSLSDYARSCVLRDLITDQDENPSRTTQMGELTNKVNILETRVEDLLKLLSTLLPDGSPQTVEVEASARSAN